MEIRLAVFSPAAQALTDTVDRLEKRKGESFPPRKAELRGGMPLK
jgi:predicted negative regulator of RcsB-dependent stress response